MRAGIRNSFKRLRANNGDKEQTNTKAMTEIKSCYQPQDKIV